MGILLPTSGKGKKIVEFLRQQLGVPSGATSFEVRIAVGEPITVKCEYLARESGEAIHRDTMLPGDPVPPVCESPPALPSQAAGPVNP